MLKISNNKKALSLILSLGFFFEAFPQTRSNLVHRVKDNEACLYGFKNEDGDWVQKANFNTASGFIQGFSIVSTNERYGIVNRFGELVVPVEYDNLTPLLETKYPNYSYNSEEDINEMHAITGFFIATRHDKKGLIDSSNRTVVRIDFEEFENFERGRGAIRDMEHKWGFTDLAGHIIATRYDEVYDFQEEGIAIVTLSDKHGLIDSNGLCLLPNEYSKIESLNDWGIGKIIKDGKEGLINKNGLLFPAKFDEVDLMDSSNIIVKMNGKYGVISKRGAEVLKPEFEKIVHMSDYCVWALKKGVYGLFNRRSGRPIIGYKIQEYRQQYFAFYIIKSNNKYGLIDKTGKIIIKPEYEDYSGTYGDEMLIFIKGGKADCYHIYHNKRVAPSELFKFYNRSVRIIRKSESEQGIMDYQGNILLAQIYKIQEGDGGFVYCDNENLCGLMDFQGHKIFSPGQFKGVGDVYNNITFVSGFKGGVGLINSRGKLVIDTQFLVVSNYILPEKYAWVAKQTEPLLKTAELSGLDWCGLKYGVIDSGAHWLLKPEYDFPSVFKNERAVLSKSKKFGVMDLVGRVIIPFLYDTIGGSGPYIVGYNKKKGILGRDGKIILDTMELEINLFENGYARVVQGVKTGLIDTLGHWIIPLDYMGLENAAVSLDSLNFPAKELSSSGTDEESDEIQETPKTQKWNAYNQSREFDLVEDYPNTLFKKVINNTVLSQVAIWETEEQYEEECYVDLILYSQLGIYRPEDLRNRYGYSSSKSSVIKIHSLTNFSVCLRDDVSIFEGRYGYSYIEFSNYVFYNDRMVKITFDSLFNNLVDYRKVLNKLLLKKIKDQEEVELDCSNPEALVNNLEQSFALTDRGLTFYFMDDESEMEQTILGEITIPYVEMKSIARPRGIISSRIEKEKSSR